ncbi:MAG: hypothetical protein HQ589_05970 [Syntrophaceae bacterium]|nr:hypothetical protein [Syntrophaceae bacterium]
MEITHVPVEWGFLSPKRPPPDAFKNFRLHKEFNTTGEFWRPSNETESISGQIFFIPGGGAQLFLNGSFEGGPKRKTSFSALNGRLAKGAPCTLIDVWGHVNAYGLNPIHYITDLHCKLFIVGGQFTREDDINIDFLDVQFSHVEKWFNSPYDLIINRDSSEYLMCFQPDEAQANIIWQGKQCKIDLFCSRTVPFGAGPSETKFKYAYRFHLSSKEKYHISWFFEVASTLRECFIYLIGTGIYTLEVIGIENYSQDSDSKPELKQYMMYLDVDVPSYIRTDASLYSTRYDNFKDHFAGFIEKWFDNRSKLAVVINTYKEILLNDGAFEENIFLRIVQTLEHLHGIAFDKTTKYCSTSEWKAFVSWFKKNTPVPDKVSLDYNIGLDKLNNLREITLNRIASLNSLTLRSRLETLFDGVQGGCLWPAIDNPNKPRQRIKEIIKEIEDTRHYLTHYRKNLKSKISKDRELERNTALLWGLLTYWIGKILNLPEEVLSEMTFQSTRAMFLVGKRTKL